MAVEGEQPKIDGDDFYATDQNTMFEESVVRTIKTGIAMAKQESHFPDFVVAANTETRGLNFIEGTGLNRIFFDDSYLIDGLYDANLISSSTNWTQDGDNFWTSTADSEIITESYTMGTISYACAYANFNIFETYDEFDDASLDPAKWSTATTGTGSVTESGGKVTLTAADTGANSAELYGDNAVLDSTHRYMVMKVDMSKPGTAVTNDIRIGISETDTSPADYIQAADTDTFIHSGVFIEYVYNPDAELVFFYWNGKHVKTVDVSGYATITPYFKVTSADGGGAVTIDVYYVRKEKPSPTGDVVLSVSADDGSNYEEIPNEGMEPITNTGTQLKLKIHADLGASEYFHLRGYGVYIR